MMHKSGTDLRDGAQNGYARTHSERRRDSGRTRPRAREREAGSKRRTSVGEYPLLLWQRHLYRLYRNALSMCLCLLSVGLSGTESGMGKKEAGTPQRQPPARYPATCPPLLLSITHCTPISTLPLLLLDARCTPPCTTRPCTVLRLHPHTYTTLLLQTGDSSPHITEYVCAFSTQTRVCSVLFFFVLPPPPIPLLSGVSVSSWGLCFFGCSLGPQ